MSRLTARRIKEMAAEAQALVQEALHDPDLDREFSDLTRAVTQMGWAVRNLEAAAAARALADLEVKPRG